MSLVRIAVRIAAVQALLGRTSVGANVLDSRLGALDTTADGELRTDEDRPFITVYTDAAKAGVGDDAPDMSNLTARSFALNGATEIIFETGITAAMTETNPETDESVIVGIGTPSTDEGFEFQLDLIARQIGDALTDPENKWAEVLRKLCHRVVRIERARAGSAEGQRMAAHQIKITVELVADPIKGEEVRPASAMGYFLLQADTLTDAEAKANVATIRAALAGEAYDWQQIRRRYGLTGAEADAMLLTPVEGAEADVAIQTVSAPAVQPAL